MALTWAGARCAQGEEGAQSGDAGLSLGPLFETFPLTLESGRSTEAVGPLYYERENEDFTLTGFPPLVTVATAHDGDRSQVFVLPPLFSWRRYGGHDTRWQVLQLISGTDQDMIDDPDLKRFTIFPFVFYQNATDPEKDYWALFPLYGSVRNRLFRDEVQMTLFPLWLKSRKGATVTRNVMFPFLHLREGPGMKGWQFWPLAGHEHLEPLTRTNSIEELEVVPGHDKTFGLWPFYFRNRTGIGSENPAKVDAVIPLYYRERSPARDHTSVMWPFISWTDDRAQKYHQWNAPWPFVSFAEGEGRSLKRVLPLFSVGHTDTLEAQTYLWPAYRRKHLKTENYERDRRQFGIVLYSDTRESRRTPGTETRRLDSWPLFTWAREADGKERLQVLALFEPMHRGVGVVRNWSPLWSLWRDELNPPAGRRSQSLLWNLYRMDAGPTATNRSLLFGLVQRQETAAGDRWRFLHLGPKLPSTETVTVSTNLPSDVPKHR